ncbi:MAG: hypothetical protein K6A33_13825 [Clostridiales bacterium]|nr:hypothetical protein [Clostridiales bacterium]
MKHSRKTDSLLSIGAIPHISRFAARDPSKPAAHTLSDAQLSALADGARTPVCEIGTWVPGPAESPAPVRRDNLRRVRTADFLTYPYPLRIEAAPGFHVAGFDETGAPLNRPDPSEADTRPPSALAVPADTPFVLVIAADEEPKGCLLPDDVSRYAAAIRIPTRTAAEVASVAESLSFVSSSVLTAVAAVAEAEEMLADRMTGVLDGALSPVCVPGRWIPSDGALCEEEDARSARTASCIVFRYDAEVVLAEGFRVTAYLPDGTFFGGWSDTFRIPAETKVFFNIERIGSSEPLDPARAAEAVRILTRPAMEIARIDARVRALEEVIRAISRARDAG